MINLTAFHSEKTGLVNEVRVVNVMKPKGFSTASHHSLPDKPMRSWLQKWTARQDWKLATLQGFNGCDQWHKVQLEACLLFNKDKTRIAGTTTQIFLIQHWEVLPVITYSWSDAWFLLLEISLFQLRNGSQGYCSSVLNQKFCETSQLRCIHIIRIKHYYVYIEKV